MDEPEATLLPTDDLMHDNSGESNFNESAYYNFFDPARRIGGFVRLGNRPNEGYAEMTTFFFLPAGGGAFLFNPPPITRNAGTDTGGLQFNVRGAFVEHRVTYPGHC